MGLIDIFEDGSIQRVFAGWSGVHTVLWAVLKCVIPTCYKNEDETHVDGRK